MQRPTTKNKKSKYTHIKTIVQSVDGIRMRIKKMVMFFFFILEYDVLLIQIA